MGKKCRSDDMSYYAVFSSGSSLLAKVPVYRFPVNKGLVLLYVTEVNFVIILLNA